MLNIDTLDTAIALVVVILLLSPSMQAVQGFIEKILKSWRLRHAFGSHRRAKKRTCSILLDHGHS